MSVAPSGASKSSGSAADPRGGAAGLCPRDGRCGHGIRVSDECAEDSGELRLRGRGGRDD
jgi:hypothetical protein